MESTELLTADELAAVTEIEEDWKIQSLPENGSKHFGEFNAEKFHEFSNRQCAEFAFRVILWSGRAWKGVDEEGTISHLYPDGSESIPLYPLGELAIQDLCEEYPGVRAVPIEYSDLVGGYLSGMHEKRLFLELFPWRDNLALLLDAAGVESDFKRNRAT